MHTALYTLYENDYHLGVATLINSALAVGFEGSIWVGYRGELPPWIDQLEFISNNRYRLAGMSVHFVPQSTSRHLGYQKARFGQEILATDPTIEAILYADPDVLFLAPWKFFTNWIENGVALVQDANFPRVPLTHPWRRDWNHLAHQTGRETVVTNDAYPNGGFFGLQRQHASFLETWEQLTAQYEQTGGDTTRYCMQERWRSITSDQDLLAATVSLHDEQMAWISPDGMGFTGHFWLLAHAIEAPKPWAKSFAKYALRGSRPTVAAAHWLRHCQGALQPLSPRACQWRRWDYRMGQLISRVWRR